MDIREIDKLPEFKPRELAIDGLTPAQANLVRKFDVYDQWIEWLARHTLLSFNMGVQHETKAKAAFWRGIAFAGWIVSAALATYSVFRK